MTETQTLTGSDLPAELLRFAKFENVSIAFAQGYRSTAMLLAGWLGAQPRLVVLGQKRPEPPDIRAHQALRTLSRMLPPDGVDIQHEASLCAAKASFRHFGGEKIDEEESIGSAA